MPRSARSKKVRGPVEGQDASRLELIRQRHQALILKPRESRAQDYGHEPEDTYEHLLGADELELAEAFSLAAY